MEVNKTHRRENAAKRRRWRRRDGGAREIAFGEMGFHRHFREGARRLPPLHPSGPNLRSEGTPAGSQQRFSAGSQTSGDKCNQSKKGGERGEFRGIFDEGQHSMASYARMFPLYSYYVLCQA